MEPDWMFLDIREDDDRDEYYKKRHELYVAVYDGLLNAEDYSRQVIGRFSEEGEPLSGFAVLEDKKFEVRYLENFCSMSYAIASHQIVFGNYKDASWKCEYLFAFLEGLLVRKERFGRTRLFNRHTSFQTVYWNKYRYKALRLGAIANQALTVRSHPTKAIAQHLKCVQEVDEHKDDPMRNPGTGELEPADLGRPYRSYLLDALSDLIRCFFRVYLLDGLSVEKTVTKQGSPEFRHHATRFRRLLKEYIRTYGHAATRERWHDTLDKLDLMCFGDPKDVLSRLEQRKSDVSRVIDRAASRETCYIARLLVEGHAIQDELLNECRGEALELLARGFAHSADHLDRVYLAIQRYG